MKKLTSIILVLTMILSVMAGCSNPGAADASLEYDAVPTIFFDITGIPQDKAVMTVGNVEVSAELYFYWVCYVCSSLE